MPYMIMAFAVGIPIFLAELFVGQYSGFGAIKAYAHLAPFFSGKQKHRIDNERETIPAALIKCIVRAIRVLCVYTAMEMNHVYIMRAARIK